MIHCWRCWFELVGTCAWKDHAEGSQSKKMSFKSQDFLFPTLCLDVSAFLGTDLFDGGMCTFWGGRFVIPQGSKSVKAPMSGCQATESSSFQPLLRQVESGEASYALKTQILLQEAGSQPGGNETFEKQRFGRAKLGCFMLQKWLSTSVIRVQVTQSGYLKSRMSSQDTAEPAWDSQSYL